MKLILLCLLLVGCATRQGFVDGDQAPPTLKKKFKVAKGFSECRKMNGAWYGVNRPAIFPDGGYCQFRASDGGHACQSSQDCQGYCELSFDENQGDPKPRCSSHLPPRWDRCVPGYYEKGKVSGRGECFGDDVEVQ